MMSKPMFPARNQFFNLLYNKTCYIQKPKNTGSRILLYNKIIFSTSQKNSIFLFFSNLIKYLNYLNYFVIFSFFIFLIFNFKRYDHE